MDSDLLLVFNKTYIIFTLNTFKGDVDSDLQVPDVERLLVDVHGVGAGRQPAHAGQVAAVAAHRLDDEDAPLGAAGRLLDAVARLDGSRTLSSY